MRKKSVRVNPLTKTAGLFVLLAAAQLVALEGCGPPEKAADDKNEGSQNPNVLQLSKEARNSIGIDVETLTRTDYAKSIRIPGQVVEIPGVTRHEVTTKTSGEIAKIHVLEGDEVKPRAALFEIELTHQEAIQYQLEMLDALAKLEVVNAEIDRLTKLLDSSEGAVPKTRLLKEQYERNHLRHTVSSRRQILGLLGLDHAEIQRMIDEHRHHQQHMDDTQDHVHEPTLITTVRLTAPKVVTLNGEEPAAFIMQDLPIQLGQHVDVGDLLCNLVDLRHLHIKGDAFQRDLNVVRRAKRNEWPLSAVFPQRDGRDFVRKELPINYIASKVDHESRSAKFIVKLPNPRLVQPDPEDDKDAPRQFLPGQRVELHVPMNDFKAAIVLPTDAVARDGLENYIFQASGNQFVRRTVGVLFRDENQVVLDEKAKVYVEKSIAMSGAYQLQLSLQNRSKGPVQHSHAGGAPHSH